MRQMRMKSMLAFLFMGILGLASPLFATEKQAGAPQIPWQASLGILEPARLSWAKLMEYLPKLGLLVLILVVGSLVALGIAGLIERFLKLIQLEKGAKQIKIPEILKKGNISLPLSDLITEIIFFLIIIVTLTTALEFYGSDISQFTAQILSYIPHVIAAMFILILGILLSLFISGIITLVGGNVRIAQSALLGNIAKYAIIVVAGFIALQELGAGIILTEKSKDIILAGFMLSLALSFGLGAQGRAEKFVNKFFKEKD